MKNCVKYVDRTIIDRYSCIDTIKTRKFIKYMVYNSMVTFYVNEYETFTVPIENLIDIY